MKKIFTALTLCFSLSAFSQYDSVSLGAGATEMVFYNINTAAKTSASNQDWQIAFSIRPAAFPYNTNQAAAIRINEAYGLKLYRSPNQKLNAWSTFDSAGYRGWQQMHNPDTTWTIGAFNINKDFANDYNYGWGAYVFNQHSVGSDSSVYLLQLPDGSFRKFAILNLAYDTAFNVQFDKLDNSDLTRQEIRKKPYNTKSFVYYDLITKSIRDKEPAISNWDLVFLRYNNTVYNPNNLTQDIGILTNDADAAYAAYGADGQRPCGTFTGSKYINTIGKTWRDANTDTVIAGITYFITGTGMDYRLRVKSSDGSATGQIVFLTGVCSAATGVNAIDAVHDISVYPVPATDVLHVFLGSTDAATVYVSDLSGRIILTETGSHDIAINTAALQSGQYVLSVSSATGRVNRMVTVVR